jgi:PilZ domain
MAQEKRRAVRLSPFVVACRVAHGDVQFPAFMTELSELGARITCDDSCPPVGARVLVEVKLARKAVQVARLSGVVVWVGSASRGPSFGVEFDQISEKDGAALARAVDDFQRLAQKLS